MLVLGLPIVDTIWVMSSRLAKGRSPFAPDMTHVHHKFLNLGMEHRFTVIVIYGITLFWAVVALLAHQLPEYWLLFAYLGGSLIFYLGLRFVLNRPGIFPLLGRDSERGLRETVLYQRLADVTDRLVPVLMVLYLAYLGIGLVSGNLVGDRFWGLFGLLFLVGAGLLLWSRNERFSLVLAAFYIGNLLLAFGIEGFDARFRVGEWPSVHPTDWLFLLMALLLAVKVMFRKEGELFLGGVELLSLGLAVFAGVVISNLSPTPELFTVLFKGVLLIMVLRILIGSGPRFHRLTFGVTMAALLIGMIQGII